MRPDTPAQLTAHALPLGMAIAAVAVMASGHQAADLLIYKRDAILDGEVWRLITGHWVHLGWRHLAMNVTGLALIWYLFGAGQRPVVWLGLVAAITLGQSLSLLVFHPEVDWYAGLSGLLHGLLAAGALLMLPRTQIIAGLTLAALAAKLGLENWQGASPDLAAWLGGPVLIGSHLYGTILGAGITALGFLLKNLSKR